MSHRLESAVAVNNNVNNTASDECIYDLYAVCNHFGSLQSGHYTGKFCSHSQVFHMIVYCLIVVFFSYIHNTWVQPLGGWGVRTPKNLDGPPGFYVAF